MVCGILNKGNTCYINASLQSFSSTVQLWTSFSLHSDTLPPFASSFVRTMLMPKSMEAALDPSQFLRCTQNIIVKSGKKDFDLFQHQDASEIMSCVFDELSWESPHAQEMLTTILKNQVICSSCLQTVSNEELMSILSLQVTSNV